MPGIKTVLAVISDPASGLVTLETAFLVGRDQGCHVTVLHVRPDPAGAVPLVGEAMSGAMVEDMMTACETEGRARAAKVRELFDQFCGRYAIPLADEPPGPAEMSASFLELVGAEDELVALRGRMADLIVLGRPTAHEDPALQATLNAALMESGRPVLVAPPAPIPALASSAVVAWNGSAEATRAVSAALPLLLKAERVTVLVAEEDDAPTSASDLETYLAWHGIAVEVRRLGPLQGLSTGPGVGAALLGAAAEAEADLLVMGAYTHSRLRQLILGGVTRHVLDHAPLPVLLSH